MKRKKTRRRPRVFRGNEGMLRWMTAMAQRAQYTTSTMTIREKGKLGKQGPSPAEMNATRCQPGDTRGKKPCRNTAPETNPLTKKAAK